MYCERRKSDRRQVTRQGLPVAAQVRRDPVIRIERIDRLRRILRDAVAGGGGIMRRGPGRMLGAQSTTTRRSLAASS